MATKKTDETTEAAPEEPVEDAPAELSTVEHIQAAVAALRPAETEAHEHLAAALEQLGA